MIARVAVIVDTNVVVAGLITQVPDSAVARLLDGMLSAGLPCVLSEALLAEYRSVLSRPKLRKAHGLTTLQIDEILVRIAQHAIVLAPVTAPPAPDPGDQLLWELLAARPDLLLVTGDKRLLHDDGMKGRVVTPRAFLDAA